MPNQWKVFSFLAAALLCFSLKPSVCASGAQEFSKADFQTFQNTLLNRFTESVQNPSLPAPPPRLIGFFLDDWFLNPKAEVKDLLLKSLEKMSVRKNIDSADRETSVEQSAFLLSLYAQAAVAFDDKHWREEAGAQEAALAKRLEGSNGAQAYDSSLAPAAGALAASALLRSGSFLDKPEWVSAGLAILDSIGDFPRKRTENSSAPPARTFRDSSLLAACCLDAYEITGREKYLDGALREADDCAQKFGAFPDEKTASAKPGLEDRAGFAVTLLRSAFADPSGKNRKLGLQAAAFVLKDSAAGGNLALEAERARVFRWAALYPVKMAVIGRIEGKDTVALRQAACRLPASFRVVEPLDPAVAAQKARLDELGYPATEEAQVFLCTEKACSPPVSDPNELKKTFLMMAR